MARLSFANAVAGILNAFGAGGQLRAKEQLAVTIDALLQMAGNANVAPGNTEPADPLNSPFTIYINPYIGSDRFVGGSYNWFEEPGGAPDAAKIAAKLKRLENQRLTCGYSKERPFRTINRAAIEIVAMTSKSFFTINSEAANVDCPSVELSPGTHIFYNDPGNSSYAIPVTEWPAAGFDPTPSHLIAFNPNSGGIVLPRYATASAPLSLRQSTVRPSYVPVAADEAADYSNRVGILKITSTSYVYGVTFRDALGASSSHHLLDCFHNASQADLDQLYAKVRIAMGGANNTGNISNSLTVTRPSEWQTVGPISGNPSEAWDTVKGASPYIYNCSLRTEWGMSGVFWDGARLAGLKSLVAAQFTGISQQRDLSCWEIYRSGAWRAPVNYQELIDSESDDVRMKPRRMSRHITALNDAFAQLVSVFAIGAGRHHFADSGAQMEFSNSTSNFGGCVAVARGYQTSSVPLDSNWNLHRIKTARSVADQTGNIRRIPLGIVASISGSAIVLQEPLAVGTDPAVPAILAASGYSLPAGTLVWIENPNGMDWRATLAANAWSSSAATEIDITGAALQADTDAAIGTGSGGVSLAIGKRVYVRRLIDTRTATQRRVTLKLVNTTSARVPVRNSILQTRPGVSGGGIDRALAPGGAEVLAVTQTNAIPPEGAGVVLSAEISIRRSCPDESYASGVFYRQGQTVKFAGKHFTAKATFTSSGSTPEQGKWQQSYVQQESAYNAEDPTTLEAPVLIFDTDTDAATDVTVTCGINWSTVYTASGSVRDQLRSATDYRGALALLLALGFNSTAAHNALIPRPEAERDLDPASATDFPTAPSGGAASARANWAVEFRQPSFVQLLGHNFNGVGFWNYSRALPRARRQLSALNEFNANFTPEQGGRVEVRGINKDGFEVTNQGLINTDTGEVVAVEGIGAEGDQSLPTQLTDLAVENLTLTGTLDVAGVVELEGGEAIAMQTSRYGLGQLATINDLQTVTQAVASDDQIDASSDKLLTLPGVNRLFIQRRFISAATTTVTIYVKASAVDRDLDSMFNEPPTSVAAAIPSLARASEYANAIIGSGNQIAEIRIAPGLYNPNSVWQCGVKFVAYNAGLTAPLWGSNSVGTAVVPNNYYDGSGYADYANSVNFWPMCLIPVDISYSFAEMTIASLQLTMSFRRGVDWDGGFQFLGLADVIKAVGESRIPIASFLPFSGLASLMTLADFSPNLATNVDYLLSRIRQVFIPSSTLFDSYSISPLIKLSGGTSDSITIRDCCFGPGLPTRKDSGGATPAMIEIDGTAAVTTRNIYIRGKTTITSAGIGVTGPLPLANSAHYGNAVVNAPWRWEQTYHTFIGAAFDGPQTLTLNLGSTINVITNTSSPFSQSNYVDLTGKLLPNHIHLLDSSGAVPSGTDTGPFFDQFIHASRGLFVPEAWPGPYESQTETIGKRLQGFVGRFGRNGYNATKTRGVLGGNAKNAEAETGFTFALTFGVSAEDNAQTIFQRAGLTSAESNTAARPTFNPSSTAPGDGFPAGLNPIITTDTSGGAALNVGLRSYLRGISVANAITIPATNVVF